MAPDTKAVHGKTNELPAPPIEEEMDEEIEIITQPSMAQKMKMIFEKVASTGMGQFVLEQSDRVLKVVEVTARWSLPQDDADAKLERPLPWIFFLSLIVYLRFLRFWLNVGSALTGGPPITPQSMIYSIQIKRRRLRALRVSGLKTMRPEPQSQAMSTSSDNRPSFIDKVRQLFNRTVCRPGKQRDNINDKTVSVQSDKAKNLNAKTPDRCSSKRPRDDEQCDLNLTVDQMLSKYANEDSDDDSDYVPPQDEDEQESTTTTYTEESTTEDETEKESQEKPKQTPHNTSHTETADKSLVEIKENGASKERPMPKPISEIKLEPLSDADSGSEKVKTPHGNAQGSAHNIAAAAGNASTEVAPVAAEQRAKMNQNLLSQTSGDNAQKKATPGHETAAALKATQRQTFTSSSGSPQDFHSIFHPAPLVNVQYTTAHSTPKDSDEINGNITVPDSAKTNSNSQPKAKPIAAGNQIKPPNQQQNHFNYNKNRNRNRR